MNPKLLTGALALAALPALSLFSDASSAPGGITVGAEAPNIEVEQWLNFPEGTSLADLRGRVVLLDFWRTW